MKQTYFISGIDTDSGKTYATSFLAKKWMNEGKSVITQKFIQTGCTGISEDILTHRRQTGTPILDVDKDGTTCPFVFTFPASPHLAARIDSRTIDLNLIRQSTRILQKQYDIVLLEGAGGLMVPVAEDYLTIDYLVDEKLPLIFVTSAKLGSINHTLLALEVCKQRGIEIAMLIYNFYPETVKIIEQDTRLFLQRYLANYYPESVWLDLPNHFGE